jgi:hypothetical protein
MSRSFLWIWAVKALKAIGVIQMLFWASTSQI